MRVRKKSWLEAGCKGTLMKHLFVCAMLSLTLAGCVATEPTTTEIEKNVGIAQGERWRMTCIGGEGAMQVPIFARLTSYNSRNGRANLLITDRDGYEGSNVVFIRGNTLTMFGETTQWSSDGRSASFSTDVCPGGMKVERL